MSETFEIILGIYLSVSVLVGFIIKAIAMCIDDPYEDIKSSIKEIGLKSFYFWFKQARDERYCTIFGLISLFIIETFFIPASIIILILSCLIDLGRLIFIKKEYR